MLKPMDKDGKYPLTGREYNALRCIVLSKNEVTNSIDSLKDRFHLIPGGWRDARMIYTRYTEETSIPTYTAANSNITADSQYNSSHSLL